MNYIFLLTAACFTLHTQANGPNNGNSGLQVAKFVDKIVDNQISAQKDKIRSDFNMIKYLRMTQPNSPALFSAMQTLRNDLATLNNAMRIDNKVDSYISSAQRNRADNRNSIKGVFDLKDIRNDNRNIMKKNVGGRFGIPQLLPC
jgi:hypothetical protein